MAKGKLSERQRGILVFMFEFSNDHGYPPTIREIGEAVDITSTSVVNYNLNILEKEGYITRDLKVSRGLRLTEAAMTLLRDNVRDIKPAHKTRLNDIQERVSDMLRIPLAGRIFASSPVHVPDATTSFAPDEVIEISRSLVKDTDDLFALQVRGDSMIDAMVNDGDIVVMRRQQQARNGEMVAVWLNDRNETTLKYFYQENGKVRLQPANPTMGPIMVDPKSVEVQGKVVLVVRQMKQ